MKFHEPEVSEVSVLDDDSEVGMLKQSDGWKFVTVSTYDYFTSSDLRAIADEWEEWGVMNAEDYKALALKCCLDIYRDYDETEVLKFAPKSVQHAWEVGCNYMATERAKDAKRIKEFTL